MNPALNLSVGYYRYSINHSNENPLRPPKNSPLIEATFPLPFTHQLDGLQNPPQLHLAERFFLIIFSLAWVN